MTMLFKLIINIEVSIEHVPSQIILKILIVNEFKKVFIKILLYWSGSILKYAHCTMIISATLDNGDVTFNDWIEKMIRELAYRQMGTHDGY